VYNVTVGFRSSSQHAATDEWRVQGSDERLNVLPAVLYRPCFVRVPTAPNPCRRGGQSPTSESLVVMKFATSRPEINRTSQHARASCSLYSYSGIFPAASETSPPASCSHLVNINRIDEVRSAHWSHLHSAHSESVRRWGHVGGGGSFGAPER